MPIPNETAIGKKAGITIEFFTLVKRGIGSVGKLNVFSAMCHLLR